MSVPHVARCTNASGSKCSPLLWIFCQLAPQHAAQRHALAQLQPARIAVDRPLRRYLTRRCFVKQNGLAGLNTTRQLWYGVSGKGGSCLLVSDWRHLGMCPNKGDPKKNGFPLVSPAEPPNKGTNSTKDPSARLPDRPSRPARAATGQTAGTPPGLHPASCGACLDRVFRGTDVGGPHAWELVIFQAACFKVPFLWFKLKPKGHRPFEQASAKRQTET